MLPASLGMASPGTAAYLYAAAAAAAQQEQYQLQLQQQQQQHHHQQQQQLLQPGNPPQHNASGTSPGYYLQVNLTSC